jgi:hypothetical protein
MGHALIVEVTPLMGMPMNIVIIPHKIVKLVTLAPVINLVRRLRCQLQLVCSGAVLKGVLKNPAFVEV